MKTVAVTKLPALTPRTLARVPKGAFPCAREPTQSRSGAQHRGGIRALVAEIAKLRAAAKEREG